MRGLAKFTEVPHSSNVNAVEVVGTKGCIAFGAFALPGVVAGLDALEAEDVETLGQDCIHLARVAARAGESRLRGEKKQTNQKWKQTAAGIQGHWQRY